MIIRYALAAVLGLVAPVSVPVAGAPASAVSVTVAPVGSSQRPEVSFEHLPVVVPSVTPAGTVVASPLLSAARSDGDVVATDVVGPSRVQSDVIETGTFQTLGLTWPASAQVGDLGAQVRTRSAGAWSAWRTLSVDDGSADVGTAEAARSVRGGTDSVWVGDADAVQLSFRASAQPGPDGLELALIGSATPPDATATAPATSVATTTSQLEADAGGTTLQSSPSTAAAAGDVLAEQASAPRIISREEWGAAPAVCTPDVASTLVGVVLHHTADSNDYATVAQAMQQIRNDQRYHIDGRGWCDIGYNFLVDKWGNVYEGRDDSGVKPVIGVHAGGFNTATVGISMLGTYSTLTPPAAVQESVARLSAWRLGQYYRDPSGSMTYHTYGGENSKYPAGTDVALPVIFAHRDVGNTACPGNGGYATLPWVRARATQLASPSLIGPSVSATSVAQGQGVTVRAATLGNISWRLDVVDARTGVALASSTGLAQQALGGVVAGWDGRNQIGQPVGTGPYLLTLSGTDSTSGAPVRPYAVTVQVTGSQNPPTVAAVPLVGNLTFVPITPVRALDTRPYAQSIGPDSRVDVVVAGTASVPADAKAVAVNITLVNPSAVTHVRAWPAGQPRPLTSVLNGDAARAATASGVVLGVGGEGKISLYNNAGSAHLVVDVTGYYTAAGGSAYAQLGAAARILDTRLQGGRMTTDETRTVTVAGVKGIPADARAVVMNVTSVRSSGNGFVSVVPSGAPRATTSTVNHLPGQDVTNRATVPLAGGKVDLTLGGAPADVVLDVVGWYGPGAAATFTPIVPVRAFDTRLTAGGGPLGEGATRTFPVLTAAGLPAGATGAVMTLTATQQSAGATFLTAWAAGAARPETSDLNTGRGRDQSNSVVVGFGTGGSIQVYNNAGTTQVIGDVFGYFR